MLQLGFELTWCSCFFDAQGQYIPQQVGPKEETGFKSWWGCFHGAFQWQPIQLICSHRRQLVDTVLASHVCWGINNWSETGSTHPQYTITNDKNLLNMVEIHPFQTWLLHVLMKYNWCIKQVALTVKYYIFDVPKSLNTLNSVHVHIIIIWYFQYNLQ